MKKFTLLLLIATVSLPLLAQKRLGEYQYKVSESPYANYQFKDLTFDEDDMSLKLFAVQMQMATVTKQSIDDETKAETSNEIIPFITVANLKAGNSTPEVIKEAIHLKSVKWIKLKDGYDYVAIDPTTEEEVSSSETAVANEELMMKYPKAYPRVSNKFETHELEVQSAWNDFVVVDRLKTYAYKDELGKLEEVDSKAESYKFKLDEAYSKHMLEDVKIVDNRRQLAIAPVMLGVKKDKIHGFTNKRIYTTSKNEIINQFDLKFDFPKSLLFGIGFGANAEDTLSNFAEGAILIYGRAFGVGKKNNDPDKTRYHVAIIDKDGNLEHTSLFNYGTEKRSIEPYYAYKKEDEIFVFSKTTGSDSPGYAVLTFDKSGLKDTKDFDHQTFQTMVVGGKYDDGLTTRYGRNFEPVNHYILSNGQVLIHGEAYETETKTEQQGDNGTIKRTEIRTYISHIFLKFDVDGTLLKEYVYAKKEGDSQKALTKFKLMQSQNNILYLYGEENQGKAKFGVIVKVDANTDKVTKTTLNDFDVFSIKGTVITKYSGGKNLVFLGRSADASNYTLKSVVFELN